MGAAGPELSPSWRRRWRREIFARPTGEGAWFVVVLLGVLVAALNTGNNLLYLVLGTLLALLLVSNALAEWNLRGIRVARRLPLDLYAREPAPGAFVVHNERRWGACWALHVEEMDAGGASAQIPRVPPGGREEGAARWTFEARGRAQLGRVRVWSLWPFGLVRRWRVFELPAEILVFPAPGPSVPADPAGSLGGARERPELAGRTGEFRGLRPYVPGDPIKDLHWPTSARAGQPMIIERGAEGADEVTVHVPERRGAAWESAISAATGQILWHLRAGHAVGLRLGRERLPPGSGDPWRRRLLGQLALAPRRDAP